MAPVALGLRRRRRQCARRRRTDRAVDRSSGAPVWPAQAPRIGRGGGGSFAAVLVPSGRGAPGAFGLADGSKAISAAAIPGWRRRDRARRDLRRPTNSRRDGGRR